MARCISDVTLMWQTGALFGKKQFSAKRPGIKIGVNDGIKGSIGMIE